jgi:hypothetical protein
MKNTPKMEDSLRQIINVGIPAKIKLSNEILIQTKGGVGFVLDMIKMALY